MTTQELADEIRTEVMNERPGHLSAKRLRKFQAQFATYTDDQAILFWLPKCAGCGTPTIDLDHAKDLAADAILGLAEILQGLCGSRATAH